MKRAVSLTIVLLLTGCATSHHHLNTPQIGAISPNQRLAQGIGVGEQSFFINYINEIRTKGSVCAAPTTPLQYNSFLQTAANEHSKDMAMNHKLTHDGSGTESDVARKMPSVGSNFFERILFFGYPAKANDLVGENITHVKFSSIKSQDKMKSFKRAIQIFLADPPHCKILMEPRFRDVGVGYYRTNDGYYWTVDFGETE